MCTQKSSQAVIQFQGLSIPVTADPVYEFTLTTKDVASGYGVTPTTIRMHKSNNPDEFIEGKHFFMNAGNPLKSGVNNIDALKQRITGMSQSTLWTKRGVIRLGFFIKSERARQFRDYIEDFVLNEPMDEQRTRIVNDSSTVELSVPCYMTLLENHIEVLTKLNISMSKELKGIKDKKQGRFNITGTD